MHTTQNELIGILGAPNSGKTTLFNWLTGAKFRPVNYPGSTVDYYLGNALEHYGHPFQLMDTPGTYSLFPQTPDEEVTWKALFETNGHEQIKKLVVVVDATQMHRHLYLAKQAILSGFKIVIAITMSDIVRKEKLQIDIEQLKKYLNCPIIEIDGSLGGGVKELVQAVASLEAEIGVHPKPLPKWDNPQVSKVMNEVEGITKKVFVKRKKQMNVFARTARVDRILLHPIFGYFIFIAVMMAVFSSIFWAAKPFMDGVDHGFSFLGETVVSTFGTNLFTNLISKGVIASFSAVMVFVPQIFILFLGIGFLEDSGYLARASTLIDRPFSKMGMNGKSFVPVLSGFACAVPAMMASRTLSNKRERFITMFIIPLMTCSARLPVYALLLTFLFFGAPAWKPAMALTVIYICSILVGGISAAILHTFMKKDSKSMYMMELPIYRAPKLRVLLKNAFDRTYTYVRRAGPVIFVLALLLWTLSTFPKYDAKDDGEKLQGSYAAMVGRTIEPIFRPMGLDWRAGVGLISAFAARETFVSSLAVMFNVTESGNETSMQSSLISQLKNATNDRGEKIFTIATVIGIIVFFGIALQCISTVSIAAREMKSWNFAIGQLVIMNVVAYILTVSIVHGLRAMGIA